MSGSSGSRCWEIAHFVRLRLTQFDVSYNELETLDDGVLRPLVRLRHLNFAANLLRTFSSAAIPPGLEFLSVRDNRLVDVSFLVGLVRLRSLDASGNGLVRLGAHLFAPRVRSSPISANFSRNAISSIDDRAFAGVSLSVPGSSCTFRSLPERARVSLRVPESL